MIAVDRSWRQDPLGATGAAEPEPLVWPRARAVVQAVAVALIVVAAVVGLVIVPFLLDLRDSGGTEPGGGLRGPGTRMEARP